MFVISISSVHGFKYTLYFQLLLMTEMERDVEKTVEVSPVGILVAVGGNEDKRHNLSILRTITTLLKKDNVRIEVITTASEVPDETGRMYTKAFKKIGGNTMELMHVGTREQGERADLVERIRAADIVFFTGGDQLRITSILGGSSLLKEVRRKYLGERCIIAGTSAGATAMTGTMIYGGTSSEALLKGNVHFTAGMGLIRKVVIDSHFIKRGRFSRLMQMVSMNPGHIGIGLGEVLLILIVALIIWGPKRLPEIARTIGKTMRAFRKATYDLTSQVTKELDIKETDSKEKERPPLPGKTNNTSKKNS